MAPAAFLAAASIAAAAAAMDAEKTPIRLAYQSVYWAVPPYVAKREGYFDALGLDVSLVEYQSGAPMIEDRGAWDVGSAGAVPAIVGASSNIVVGITNDESAANALVGPSDASAWPPETIDASAIALTPRSTGELAVQKCLATAGFDLDAPTYIEGQPSEVLDSLASGAAAYGGLWAPNTYAYLEGAAEGETRSVLCTGVDAGVAIPGAIFVNKDFGADQPEAVAKLLAGWLRGIEFVKDPANEEAYLNYSREFYAEHGKTVSEESMRTDLVTRPLFGLDDQVNILWGNALAWFGVIAAFMGDAGQLDPVPEPDAYITPKFMEMVQADEMLGAYARGDDVVLDIESSSNDSVEEAQIDGQAGMTEAISDAPVTEQPEPPSSASPSVGCALNIVLQVALLVTACVLLLGSSVDGAAAPVDLFPECKEWAERGDCKPGGRPYFMQKNCPESCHKATHREPQTRHIADDQEAFCELSAKTANGKVFAMENTEGYVTVLVNAARVCDYSEVFYSTLEHMHSVHPYALEILAFPFEHSAIDIEPCRDAIESVEKEGDAKTKIHIMEAVKINGPDTHPIYQYLKKLFDIGEDEMDPNFSHYFFIDPDGSLIELHYGASYDTLKSFVDFHVKHDLGDEEQWEL